MSEDWHVELNRGNHWGLIEVVGPAIHCQGFRIAADGDHDRALRITSEANLIAAAPKMLATLINLRDVLRTAGYATDDADAAIAKATGGVAG